jgi:hypothetical protein
MASALACHICDGKITDVRFMFDRATILPRLGEAQSDDRPPSG